ncbi:26S proteasome non-ATPase regulatory subunit 5 [Sporodiniella umbellata]|nr:26S proteasome non-ATPase regulatory subunit 5 [Sporodiniella umbellata]
MLKEQVAEALDPKSNVPLKDRANALEEFSCSLKEPVSREQSEEVLSSIPLELFYYGFSLENESLTVILCDIIHKLISPLHYTEIVSPEKINFLIGGLTHYDSNIRFLSIQQVFKCLESIESTESMIQSQIFIHVIVTLSFQDTKTAQKAGELLYEITKYAPGQEALLGPTACGILQQVLTVSETVKFRIYELIIKVASRSSEAFELCEKTGLLNTYLDELQADDLLVKLNAIEMLNEVATTDSGVYFLEKADLVEGMTALLRDTNEDITVSLIKCSLIKFIGNLGENSQVPFQRLSSQYGILDSFKLCLDSNNEEEMIATISSVGLIGSHLAGLTSLSDSGLIDIVADLYPSSIGPTKAVLLQTLSKWIGVRQEPEDECNNLTKHIFKKWSGFPEKVLKDARQPDDSIRFASLALIQSIAYHSWGIEYISQSGVFIQYLLDRSTERAQQGQMWKYSIIQTLLSNSKSREMLTHEDYEQLQIYVHQGPYYRSLEANVAFESN